VKKTTMFLICLLSASLISCGEGKFAERYAAKMSEVLKTYRDRVEAKIQAEQQSYVDLAKIYDSAASDRIQNQLDLSRNTRSREFSDRIQKGAQGTPPDKKYVWTADIHAALQSYAADDFKQAEALLTREMDAYKQTLQDLDDLSVDQTNLNKLQDQLAALAQPKTTVERLKALADFGCDVNRNFRLLEIDSELSDLGKRIDAEKNADKKASLQKQQISLQEEKTKLSTPCKV
jgi:hypothetical protein